MRRQRRKTVQAIAGGSVIHVETPLGVVNIRAGLLDDKGRRVDAIEILPDHGKARDGQCNVRIVEPKADETKVALQVAIDGEASLARKALEIVRALAVTLSGPDAAVNAGDILADVTRRLEEAGFRPSARAGAEQGGK